MSVDTILWGSSFPPSTSIHFVRWHSPPLGFVKLNFDGSLINFSAVGGFIIRDWIGRLPKAGAKYYGNSSILVAEARALPDGLYSAIEEGFNHLIVKYDKR